MWETLPNMWRHWNFGIILSVCVCVRMRMCACVLVEVSSHLSRGRNIFNTELSPQPRHNLIWKSSLLPTRSTSKQRNTIQGAKWGGLALWLSQAETLATKPYDLSSVPRPTAVEGENTFLYIILWPPQNMCPGIFPYPHISKLIVILKIWDRGINR